MLRAHGFASIAADHRGGWLITTSIPVAGRRLLLNLDASHGEVIVRARREDRSGDWLEISTIRGVTATVCRIDIPANLPKEAPIQMRFDLTSAELFSWGFDA